MISFPFKAHNYFITEQATDGLYVKIHREMRTKPFIGMKQPAPSNSLMGFDAVLTVKHHGQPAIHFDWQLLKDDVVIQTGKTDHEGKSCHLRIQFCEATCECLPLTFRHTKVLDDWQLDLNERLCGQTLPSYVVSVAVPLPRTAPSDDQAVEGEAMTVSATEGHGDGQEGQKSI